MAPSLRQRVVARSAPFSHAGAEAADHHLIADSGLFDRDWYLDLAPEVEAGGGDPVLRFLHIGSAERRAPGPRFSLHGYLGAHPDVAWFGSDGVAPPAR